MIAERSTTHVADTLALLTSAYRGRTAIKAIVRAFANRTQEVEAALWAVSDAMQFANTPVGVWLDALGEIAGEPRLARGDAEYLLAVRAKLRVNRSFGRTTDIVEVMILIGLAFQYNEDPSDPGGFSVDTYGNAYPATIARLLALAKPAGNRADLRFTSLPRAPVIAGGRITSGPGVWGETRWASTRGGELTSWTSMREAKP